MSLTRLTEQQLIDNMNLTPLVQMLLEATITSSSNQAVAQTIIQQLGGGRFRAMTGAKSFAAIENGVDFRIPGNTKSRINHVKIVLNSMDTYDVTFGRIQSNQLTVIKSVNGLYNDQLEDIFRETTGLDTRF